MTADGWWTAVENAAQGRAAPEAIDEVRIIWDDERLGDVTKAARLAELITRLAMRKGTTAGSQLDSYQARGLIPALSGLKQIEAHLVDMRKTLFGAVKPPFLDYDKAVGWIESQPGFDPKKLGEWDLEKTLSGPFEWPLPPSEGLLGQIAIDVQPRVIRFAKPDSARLSLRGVLAGSPLDDFERYLSWAEAVTGLSEPLLVMHALTPFRPLVPRWRVHFTKQGQTDSVESSGYRVSERTRGASLRDWYCTVEVNDPNMTWQDHREIYKLISRQRRTRAAPFNQRDRILIQVIEELGEEPMRYSRDRAKYWAEVLRMCRQKGVKTWNDPDTPRRHLARLRQKGFG